MYVRSGDTRCNNGLILMFVSAKCIVEQRLLEEGTIAIRFVLLKKTFHLVFIWMLRNHGKSGELSTHYHHFEPIPS